MKAREQLALPIYAIAVAPDYVALYPRCVFCDAAIFEIGEYYMVRDEVWPLDPDGGMLCIACLEARIGRRLTPEDFTACSIFPGDHVSARIRARMGMES